MIPLITQSKLVQLFLNTDSQIPAVELIKCLTFIAENKYLYKMYKNVQNQMIHAYTQKQLN